MVLFEIIYWIAAVIVTSLMLAGSFSTFGEAFLVSAMLLPGALFAKYFLAKTKFEKPKDFINCLYIAVAVLFIEYLCIFLTEMYLNAPKWYDAAKNDIPKLIFNPVFLWFMLMALLVFEKIIKQKFASLRKTPVSVEFISDRKKVSVEISTITYIESNDTEVWIRTTSGISYRTKMKISQWEKFLDDRFVRIHRSYIVNKDHVIHADRNYIYISEGSSGNPTEKKTIEISRKYKRSAIAAFKNGPSD
ncbi:MAG: LytTR family transcriptional regulator [Bacteroidales bacterium]|jgi:uncharacterized membrane protein YhaH (DUF805 family)|nr:LytTR family transcriptional regulator [Bacteroidales bacterium]